MQFARFMASTAGRVIRIVVGLVLIVAGLAIGSVGGTVLAIVGVVPLVAGALNVCLLAPILKAPFNGKDVLAGRN
jgi:hypothetical protein